MEVIGLRGVGGWGGVSPDEHTISGINGWGDDHRQAVLWSCSQVLQSNKKTPSIGGA